MLEKCQLVTLSALILAVISALLLIAVPAQAQTETVLYNFVFGSDGYNPYSSLTPDGKGNFYGTTYSGGVGNDGYGYGTAFEISPNGNGGWDETVIYSFCSAPGCADGSEPFFSNVIFDSAGNLYGTTALGGAYDHGVVFELSPTGTSWSETVLHSFDGADGAGPANGLIMDPAGNLYGTTLERGAGENTVFELSKSGGNWTEQVIHTIKSNTFGGGLTMDPAGNIFGISGSTVFELLPLRNGRWNKRVLYTFPDSLEDSWIPAGTPVLDQVGNLYGTTFLGGAAGYGTVYKLSPGKKGKWTEKILHSFKDNGRDGNAPYAGLVLDAAGDLYGATYEGGKYGAGTVFELVAPVGPGSYKEKVLWSFDYTDGWAPYGSLILDSTGNLYGTTVMGGSSGAGVVFEVTP